MKVFTLEKHFQDYGESIDLQTVHTDWSLFKAFLDNLFAQLYKQSYDLTVTLWEDGNIVSSYILNTYDGTWERNYGSEEVYNIYMSS